MREIEWAAFHINEDAKEDHEKIVSHRDMLMSFVNPAAFKAYHTKTNKGSQIENEAFADEIKDKLGLSLDQLNEISNETDQYAAEDIDIIGEPTLG